MITSAGEAYVAGLAGALTTPHFSYMAIGTDSTAASAAQTALLAEITTGGGSRTSATISRVTTENSNDTVRFVATWTFTGSHTIREVGIFSASSSGTMLLRQVINQSVVSGQVLQITIDVQVDS